MHRLASRGPLEVAGYAFTLAIAFLVFSAALGAYLGWNAPLLLGLVIGAAAGVITAALLTIDRNKLLWHIETALDKDFNKDGQVGPPRFIYVRGARESQRHKEIEEAERFRLFLQGVYGDRGPTWRAWDGVLTQEQWQDYCGRLLDANLAERKGETSPLTLPSTYRDALRVFAEIL